MAYKRLRNAMDGHDSSGFSLRRIRIMVKSPMADGSAASAVNFSDRAAAMVVHLNIERFFSAPKKKPTGSGI